MTEFLVNIEIKKQGRYSVTPDLLSALIGAMVLFICWLSYIPQTLKYKKEKIWIPLVLTFILSLLIYLNLLEINAREILPGIIEEMRRIT